MDVKSLGDIHRLRRLPLPSLSRLRRFSRLSPLLAIRYTPLPWTAKRWLIWLGGPKVLLSACALIEEERGRVLSLRSRYTGDWQLPGGCVRRRETAMAAVQRECLEELGLAVRDPRLLGICVDDFIDFPYILYRDQLVGSGFFLVLHLSTMMQL